MNPRILSSRTRSLENQKRWHGGSSLLRLICALIFLFSLFSPPNAAAMPNQAPGDTIVRCGSAVYTGPITADINVTIYVENVTDMFGAEVKLSFNVAGMQVVDADSGTAGVQITPLGGFLKTDFVIKKVADNTLGTIWYANTELNPSLPVTGSGDIAQIAFHPLAAGSYTLTFTTQKLALVNGDQIPAVTQDCTINFTDPNPPGAFTKTSPTNGAIGVATNPTLSWGTSSGAASYEYCYAITTGCTSWTTTGTATSVGLSGLSNSQIYYWQVRAVNTNGNTQADSGTYWSFTTAAPAPPGAFNKTSPANGAISQPTNPTLSWGTSSGATSYEYCYAITTGCTSWTSVGTATSVGLSGLSNSQIYYWQVRAVNLGGNTLADSGTYWSFTTAAPAPPGAFNKTSPANGAVSQPTNPTLSWGTSSGATSYEYCYAITTGCTSWTSVGTATSVGLSGLNNSQIYYWQVRAVNLGGNTLADSSTYWSFTTAAPAPPGAFNKTSPANGAVSQPTNPTLSWGTSSNATSYEYCYAITTGCTSWTSVGTATSVGLSGLSNSQIYYWQVRAVNLGGNTLADSGTYWSFTTIPAAPGAFSKTSPTNGATAQPTNPTLSWGTSTGAASYEYCYAITTGCTSWTSVGIATSVGLSGLSNSQIYYWQVRAVNLGGNTLADSGTYWSFTTAAPEPPGAFNKISPTNAATAQPTNPTLSWGTSSNATSYEYCYDTTNDSACSAWISTGMITSANLSGLNFSTTYYWQVRANNVTATTYADGSNTAYWSFTTGAATPPGAFSKINPVDDATAQPVSLNLSWGRSSNATSYQYCYDTVDDNACSSWISAGSATSVHLSNLIANATFYWHVRAINATGTTYANGSATAYWSFTRAGPTFADVPTSHWAFFEVERLYLAGFTDGCGLDPLVYCPERAVTRAEMAVFIERGIHGAEFIPPTGTGVIFADVPLSYWSVNWIEKLYSDRITIGCSLSPLMYCPERPITRAEMAVFLLKAKHGADYVPPAAVGIFTDVPTSYWDASWIEQLYAEGITIGCTLTPLSYCPENSVTRAEMAAFLVRTFNLP